MLGWVCIYWNDCCSRLWMCTVQSHPLDNMYYTDILSFRLLSFYLGKTAWRICWARDVLLLSLWLCTMQLDGTVHAASNGMSLSRNMSRSAQRNWPGTVPPARCPDDLYTSLARPHPQFWSVHLLRKRQCSSISAGVILIVLRWVCWSRSTQLS